MDYCALPHYDSGNVGPSTIVSFGCYTGGELVLASDSTEGLIEVNTFLTPVVGNFSAVRHWTKPLSGLKFSLVFFRLDLTGSKKGRVKQKQLTAEEVIKYVDDTHMFNPVPAVSRVGNGRAYVAVSIPNPSWSGLDNPDLY